MSSFSQCHGSQVGSANRSRFRHSGPLNGCHGSCLVSIFGPSMVTQRFTLHTTLVELSTLCWRRPLFHPSLLHESHAAVALSSSSPCRCLIVELCLVLMFQMVLELVCTGSAFVPDKPVSSQYFVNLFFKVPFSPSMPPPLAG